jgi:GNAT superfamily N-acetyltransferase
MTGTEHPDGAAALLVRPFRSADHDELLALNDYGLTAAGISAGDDYYAGQDLSDLPGTYSESAGGAMLVGEVGGKIVAMGGIRRVDRTVCELLRMRVYPEHQGHGYGTSILDALEREAGRLGYQTIRLVTGENQRPAVDIYAKRGYRVVRRELLMGIPSVHMSKELARPETSLDPGRAVP